MTKKNKPKGSIKRGFGGIKKSSTPTKAQNDILLSEELAHQKVIDELSADGIDEFTNEDISEDYLQLPMFLVEVTSAELGNYFNTFTKQRIWVRTVRGRLRGFINDLEYDLDHIRFRIYSSLPTKMPSKEKEVAILGDSKAVEMLERLKHYKSKLHIVDAYLDNLEDGIHNISREITRRSNDFAYSKKGD